MSRRPGRFKEGAAPPGGSEPAVWRVWGPRLVPPGRPKEGAMVPKMGRRSQRGISTVTALFLVTVLVGVGVAGAALFRAGQDAATVDLQALRAAEAARAGLEWASWRITRPLAPVCAATTNLANLPGTLAPYVVTVGCQANGPYNEGGPSPVNTYALRAVACNQPLPAAAPARCPNPAPADGYIEQEARAGAER